MKAPLLLITVLVFLNYSISQEKTEVYILFEKGDSSLTVSETSRLDSLTKSINNDLIQKIILSGHTDSEGSKEYNYSLSRKRTKTIKAFLVKSGIDSVKINSHYYGEEKLLSEQDKLNRRVSVQIMLKQKDSCVGTYRYALSKRIPIDVNDDQNPDFFVEYSLKGNQVYSSASGYLQPQDNSDFLWCRGKHLSDYSVGDTIFKNLEKECKWTGFNYPIVKFDKEEMKWKAHNSQSKTIFIPIKLVEQDNINIGWIELTFDSCTGLFETKSNVYNSAEYVIIK